ncbi:Vacuolar protein sorting-associated protein 52 [Pseudozyma hubeiensis]|nr:Vacuolar protein sorting-associated protein 52 [Pseudozyma hubeiensis]
MSVDDARAEQLASKATSAASLTASNSTSIQSLYSASLLHQSQQEQQQDETYLSLAPTFLSLHQQASSSKQLLSSLESFLSTFQTDLSALSTHISALQNTSHQIDSRLDATRDVEVQLAQFLSEIALSPRIVDLFFESEPEQRTELWLKAVKQLERVLEATSPSAALSFSSTSTAGDIPAVQEVRKVAEACKNVVASKLRTYLIAPHAAIRASVTTNLQVLQTSILLRHHKPFYGFLARQAPRVAIDVQRSYIVAARLYFETAFRRYARSLSTIRKRWVESSSATPIIDSIPTKPDYASTAITALQSGMSALSKATQSTSTAAPPFPTRSGVNTPPSSKDAAETDTANPTDPWLHPPTRLQYSQLHSHSSTVLGYLADESGFKASPENLFRSLSLVLMDNACSEYCFLVRFFEGAGQQEDDISTGNEKPGDDADESISVVDTEAGGEEGVEATVVQLSSAEQKRMQSRGATEEIFKQIFEPAISTWTTFTKSLLSAASGGGAGLAASATSVVSGGVGGGVDGGGSVSGYFSLLSMIRLNDSVLSAMEGRGIRSGVVESALMGFKITSYPVIKKFLDDQISSLSLLLSSPTSSSSSTSMWSMISSTLTTTTTPTITPHLISTIIIRYTSLLTKTLWILSETPDQAILSSLNRLRSQLEKTILTSKPTATWTVKHKRDAIHLLIDSIESSTTAAGTALASNAKVQNEFAFWNERLASLRT